MKKIIIGASFLALIIIAIFYFVPQTVTESEAMGTFITVKGKDAGLAVSEIKRLDHLFSNFDPSSEVSLINARAGISPLKVSDDTFKVVAQSLNISRVSAGAFDITLGRGGNYRDIILDENDRTILLKRKGMKIDLGGIGKGFAVERATESLRSNKVKKALIDMRSSIAAIGGPWRIGVIDPTNESNVLGVVTLRDGDALSTSGQYEQPGHIIDPRSGRKADQCLSVTIIGKDAGQADALTTAVFVLGPESGMELISKMKVRGIIVTKSGKIVRNTELL
jgi:thiamine biosynthesis lipoprotein